MHSWYNTHTRMFLGKVLNAGARFIGKAQTAGRFLGKVAPQLSRSLSTIQQASSNQAIRDLGQKAGIKPKFFNQVGNIASGVNQAVSLAPGVAADIQNAFSTARTNLAGSQRSIADLYRQVQM